MYKKFVRKIISGVHLNLSSKLALKINLNEQPIHFTISTEILNSLAKMLHNEVVTSFQKICGQTSRISSACFDVSFTYITSVPLYCKLDH
jgi:hypothetical protein